MQMKSLVATVSVALGLTAAADTFTWTPAGSDDTYETLSNWRVGGSVPANLPTSSDGISTSTAGQRTLRLTATETSSSITAYGATTLDLNGNDFTLAGGALAVQFASAGSCSRVHWSYDLPTASLTIRGPGKFKTPGSATVFLAYFGGDKESGLHFTDGAQVALGIYPAWRNGSRVIIDNNASWDPKGDLDLNHSSDTWEWDHGTGFVLVRDGGLFAATNRTISACSDNWLHVMDRGTAVIGTLNLSTSSSGSRVFNGWAVVSNGVLDVRNGINVGGTKADSSTPCLYVCGEHALVTQPVSKTVTFYETTGASLVIRVPENGFSDRSGNPRAPIQIGKVAFNTSRSASYTDYGDTKFELWCMGWADSHLGETIDLITAKTGETAGLETLAGRLVFGDVPQALVDMGLAPTLEVVDDGTNARLRLKAPTKRAEATPPEFTVTSEAGPSDGVRRLNLNVISYGYLATKASRIDIVWWDQAASETAWTQTVADVTTKCPVVLGYDLPGGVQRHEYAGRVTMVSDIPLTNAVDFTFTDAGFDESYYWNGPADGMWQSLSKWLHWNDWTKPVLECPNAEDIVYFATNRGSYTISLDADAAARRFGNGVSGSVAEPSRVTFDLNGHALSLTETSPVTVLSSRSDGYTPTTDKTMPPGTIAFRNGTLTSSQYVSYENGYCGGLSFSNVNARLNIGYWGNGMRVEMMDNTRYTMDTKTIYMQGFSTMLRVAGDSVADFRDCNVYMYDTGARIYVEDGGVISNSIVKCGFASSHQVGVVVDDATFWVNGDFDFGMSDKAPQESSSASFLSLSGTRGLARCGAMNVCENKGIHFDFNVPEDGYRDGSGTPREALNAYGFKLWTFEKPGTTGAPFAVNVRCRDWARKHPNEQTPIARMLTTGATAFTNAVRFVDSRRVSLVTREVGDQTIISIAAGPTPGMAVIVR